jgi:hypothetical protein
MMPTVLSPKHNDWYEELCALGAVGELSASEFDELQEHLGECENCRNLYADFRRIASEDLGLVAVLKQSEHAVEGQEEVPEREMLSRVLDRASRARASSSAVSPPPLPVAKQRTLLDRLSRLAIWLRQPALSYGSLALLVCIGVAIGAYRFREAQLTPKLEGLSSEVEKWRGAAETSEAQQKSVSDQLRQAKADRESLEKTLSEAQARYTELAAQEKALQTQLSSVEAEASAKDKELTDARGDADGKNKQIAELQTRVENASSRSEVQRRIAENLQAKLQGAEQVVPATPESQGFNDADAKELFGARDLHMVDVFDVDTSGKTQRTYGRVYYVEKKLLIFYAFDLQDKKHNHAAAGFQAWGYREGNQNKAESLGLFNLDDASMNRWVLKVNNPRVLERVDAVYVTLEPPNGSPSPRGRRLLYANLVTPANHP